MNDRNFLAAISGNLGSAGEDGNLTGDSSGEKARSSIFDSFLRSLNLSLYSCKISSVIVRNGSTGAATPTSFSLSSFISGLFGADVEFNLPLRGD